MSVQIFSATVLSSGVTKSVAPGGKKLNDALPPPSPPLPPPLPSLELGPLNPARGSVGALQAPPAGPKSNFVHFSLKIGYLVATILMIFLRID